MAISPRSEKLPASTSRPPSRSMSSPRDRLGYARALDDHVGSSLMGQTAHECESLWLSGGSGIDNLIGA